MTMTADAHVGLSKPCGRYHPAAGCPPPPPGQSVDYNINSPIGTHGSKGAPLCKHTVPYTQRTTYRAGETINTQYSVGAAHGGGHCQWALSYDNGQTWVVIKTLIRECLRNAGTTWSYPVEIPAGAPSGKATFMWLWNNAVGNRELYSNCADIEIQGTNGGSISGVEPLIANYGPDSLLIPEFSSGNNDKRAEFDKRKPITVRVGAGAGSSDPQPVTTTKAPAPTNAVPTPAPTNEAVKTVTVTKTVTLQATATCRP
ncbi:hypothetical protein B0O80DRAFT_492747 [Mortierella sp. GBAus27b]|nr:hypothetical protein B0O80DRAFT_492747 [Mortierella sp. GBAus27b]